MRRITSPTWIALATTAAAASCLDGLDPIDSAVMCEIESDCDAGEICDQGVCWGNPPATATFAAVLIPPDDRTDLATTEIARLEIGPDGTAHGLAFDPAVEIRGRVVLACDGLDHTAACLEDISIPARIQITRPSAIPGAPRFSRTITARGGVGPGDDAFSFKLPLVGPGEPPYEVTVRPAELEVDVQEQSALEALAPPLRTTIGAEAGQDDVVWVLGEPDEHVELTGRVADAAGRGIAERRVYAVGRWPGASEDERVSTTATTDDDGAYRLWIPRQIEGSIDVIARPLPDELAPRLRAEGIAIPALAPDEVPEPFVLEEIVMPSHPSPMKFALPVDGADPGGGKVPVSGAKVTMQTVLASDPGIVATYSATSTTDDDGVAELTLIPAGENNRVYVARISPPSSSLHAASEPLEIAVGSGNRDAMSFLAAVALRRRVLVDGEVLDVGGGPIEAAQVEARVSPTLSWNLPVAARSLVSDHYLPTSTTDESGHFVIWLDPVIADHPAIYDLAVVPPARFRAPRWSLDRLEMGRESTAITLGSIELPRASHARGVVEAAGEPVPGAELWLYELGLNSELCEAAYAPGGDSCEPPARLRGLRRAADDGSIWLVLPDRDGSPRPGTVSTFQPLPASAR